MCLEALTHEPNGFLSSCLDAVLKSLSIICRSRPLLLRGVSGNFCILIVNCHIVNSTLLTSAPTDAEDTFSNVPILVS